MWPRIDGLRTLELGTPGELRDWLNGLVLDGTKRATAGLVQYDYLDESEELEKVGERLVLVDGAEQRVAEVEVTAISVVPFSGVGWDFAVAEGEGFRSVNHWKRAHVAYWGALGRQVAADSEVACLQFRLIKA